MDVDQAPRTVAEFLARMDEAWAEFQGSLARFPAERLDEQIGEGWTRKQMLAHLAAWHESANERLAGYVRTGEKQQLTEDDDVFNARAARGASGRTAGEVRDALESSFGRLRRQVSHLTDEQLAALEGWPAGMIASNTYQHYREHLADLDGR
jgi:hypothetical protein